ncbi:hypothetical protein OSI01_11785 [Mycobacterium ulcerans]
MEVAIAACAVALIVLSGFLVDLCNTTSQDHSELHSATQKLTDMLATLPTLSDPGPGLAGAPLPPSQSDPEFNVAGLFDRTGQLPEAAEISVALADLPGSVEFSVPTLPGPGFPDFGAPDLPVPGLAGLPTLPEPAALATPPAMAQLAAPLRRLTGLSGTTGALAKLTNTASQQAQLIAALTHDKPGTAGAPPTHRALRWAPGSGTQEGPSSASNNAPEHSKLPSAGPDGTDFGLRVNKVATRQPRAAGAASG